MRALIWAHRGARDYSLGLPSARALWYSIAAPFNCSFAGFSHSVAGAVCSLSFMDSAASEATASSTASVENHLPGELQCFFASRGRLFRELLSFSCAGFIASRGRLFLGLLGFFVRGLCYLARADKKERPGAAHWRFRCAATGATLSRGCSAAGSARLRRVSGPLLQRLAQGVRRVRRACRAAG